MRAGCATSSPHRGQWLHLDAVPLAAGPTTVRLTYSGDDPAALGPLALTPPEADGEQPVIRIAPSAARLLCDGRRYDWVGALG